MLDILMPVGLGNCDLAVHCLESIRRDTDVPFRVVVMVDGGTPGDYANLEEELHQSDHKWAFRHRKKVGYFNACLFDLARDIENEWVALIPPEIALGDDKWFGKMQMVFLRDPTCYIVDAQPGTTSKTIPPYRRTYKDLAKDCRFILSRKREVMDVLAHIPLNSLDPIMSLETRALKQGGTVWCAPGVNYNIRKHVEHETCRSSSDTKAAQFE